MGIRMMIVTVLLGLSAACAASAGAECFNASDVVDMAASRRGVVLAVDGAGRVAAMYPDGECAVLAVVSDTPSCLAVGPDGTVFVGSAEAGTVWRVDRQGNARRVALGLGGLSSLTVDRDGDVLAAVSGQSGPVRLAAGVAD